MSDVTVLILGIALLFLASVSLIVHIIFYMAFYHCFSRNDEDLYEEMYHGYSARDIFPGADMKQSIDMYKSWFSILVMSSNKVTNRYIHIAYKASFAFLVFTILLNGAFAIYC